MRAPLLRLTYCNAQQQHHSTALHSTTVTRDETSHQPRLLASPFSPSSCSLVNPQCSTHTLSSLPSPHAVTVHLAIALPSSKGLRNRTVPAGCRPRTSKRQTVPASTVASQLALQDLAAFPMGGAMRQLLSFLGAINGRPTPRRRRTTTLRRRLVRDGGAEGQDELRARGQECFLRHA